MGKAGEEIREGVVAAAEELAEELIKWQSAHPRYTMSELEKEMLKLRERFGAQVTEAMLGRREEQLPVPGPKCKICGAEMQYKGSRRLQHNSCLGEVEVARGYYYCAHCKSGIFPPG